MHNNNDYPLTHNGAKVQQLLDAIQPAIQTVQPVTGMLPNRIYSFGFITEDTTFLLNTTDIDSSIANCYHWVFITGGTAPTITWPASIRMWTEGDAPEIEEYTYYEIDVMNGVAVYVAIELPQEMQAEEQEGE